MELQYRLMYRARVTPWERHSIPEPLRRLTSGPTALPPGIALDLGCGTGRNATHLADSGWQVTGVDVAAAAIKAARRRSDQVTWQVADLQGPVMDRIRDPLQGRVSLILDVGCLHGLSDTGRRRWAQTVNTVAGPGATVLLWAMAWGHRPGPRGIHGGEIGAALGEGWSPQAEAATRWFRYERT